MTAFLLLVKLVIDTLLILAGMAIAEKATGFALICIFAWLVFQFVIASAIKKAD